MKKTIISLIVGASLAIAPSAFSLTSMSDDSLKAATGQAGVSIAIDNVVIESYTGSTSYTDDTGTDGTAGSVVISDKHTIKAYLAMTSATDFADDFNAATGIIAAGTWVKASALSIDVGTCSILTEGLNDNLTNLSSIIGYSLAEVESLVSGSSAEGVVATLVAAGVAYDEASSVVEAATNTFADAQTVTGVVIGLPTLLISTTADEYTVGVAKADAINDGDDFIRISKGASAMAILSGTVEIAAH